MGTGFLKDVIVAWGVMSAAMSMTLSSAENQFSPFVDNEGNISLPDGF